MKKYFIYKIECAINGKVYIGCTINYESRIYAHQTNLKRGIHTTPLLQSDYNKYGINNFKYSIVLEIYEYDKNWLEIEQTFIQMFDMDKGVYNVRKKFSTHYFYKGTDNIRKNMPTEILTKGIEFYKQTQKA